MKKKAMKSKKKSVALCIAVCVLLAVAVMGVFTACGPKPAEPATQNNAITETGLAATDSGEQPAANPTEATPAAPTDGTDADGKIWGNDPGTEVYVSNRTHTVHHLSDCSGMQRYTTMTLQEAFDAGYKQCPQCW